MCPRRPFYVHAYRVFFFPSNIRVVVLFGIFGSSGIPHFFQREKAKTKTKVRERLDRGALNTCVCKIAGSISQKRREHLEFCAVKCKITAWRRNYLVLVYIRFSALNLTWYTTIYTKYILFLPSALCRYLLPRLRVVSPVQQLSVPLQHICMFLQPFWSCITFFRTPVGFFFCLFSSYIFVFFWSGLFLLLCSRTRYSSSSSLALPWLIAVVLVFLCLNQSVTTEFVSL